MDALIQDLRYAVRQLRRSPGFTVVAVLTLALGIGPNTAIFSVIDGVLLRPAPVDDPDRLALVWQTDRNSGTTREPASYPDFVDFRERSTRFEDMAAFAATEVNLTPEAGDPARLAALRVTQGFLPILGVDPIVGRTFTADEDRPGGPRVVLISEELWSARFDRDPDLVGRTIRIDETPATVVGVLPSSADFGTLQILRQAAYARSFADRTSAAGVDLWLPLQADPDSTPRQTHPYFVLGRLSPESTVPAARQEMRRVAADLEELYPGSNAARGAFVEPLTDVVYGRARPALLVLLGAVGLVLLAACVNVANLLLARGAERSREIGIRRSLGASTGELARQFVAEGVVLALAGAAAGLALAYGVLEALLALAPPDLPRLETVGVDLRVLGATLLLSLLVGVVFGLVPTFQARGVSLRSVLGSGGGRGGTAGRARQRTRRVLVVAELVLAVLLVVSAGLLTRSFLDLQDVDPGVRTEGVVKAEYQLPTTRYPRDFASWPAWNEAHRFNRALLQRVGGLPGVTSAGLAGEHPLDQGFTNSFQVVGREAEAADWPEISVRRVSPGYLETVDLEVVRGRSFRGGDDTDAAPVALISETAAERFFPRGDALGQRIAMWGAEREIVGVVSNVRFHGLREPPPIALYLPLAQAPSAGGSYSLVVRSAGEPSALTAPLRSVVRELDPGLAVFGVESLERTLGRSVSQERFTTLLLGAFAALALLLGAVGIYGVIAYAVSRRRSEIGVRMAMGARARDVVGLFVRDGAAMAGLGIGIGLLAALGATRLLSSLLYGVSPTDPLTFVVVPATLALVALAATWIPARRAAAVEPMTTLRAE